MDGGSARCQALHQSSVSSTPTWSFMPQRHCFPFLGCRISGSPSLPWFFLDEGSREHRRRGRVANSPNPEAAQRFTEFLADESADYAKASRDHRHLVFQAHRQDLAHLFFRPRQRHRPRHLPNGRQAIGLIRPHASGLSNQDAGAQCPPKPSQCLGLVHGAEYDSNGQPAINLARTITGAPLLRILKPPHAHPVDRTRRQAHSGAQ